MTEYMIMLTDEEYTALKKKYFPRVEWTENGPVRRKYRVRTAAGVTGMVAEALAALARREQFTGPDQRTVIGGAEETLAAFRKKASDPSVGMVFGSELDAHWSDVSIGPADADGWQTMIVRSEEGENLIALAHGEGLLRFRRA